MHPRYRVGVRVKRNVTRTKGAAANAPSRTMGEGKEYRRGLTRITTFARGKPGAVSERGRDDSKSGP